MSDTSSDTPVPSSQPFTINDIKERIRPKEARPEEFLKDCRLWWDSLPCGSYARKHSKHQKRPWDDEEAKLAVLKHLPFTQDQVKHFPWVRPNRKATVKPPSMSFGWVISADEIRALGEREDAITMLDEDGTGLEENRVYDSEATAEEVLDRAMIALGLSEKYPVNSIFFNMTRIVKDFDEDDKDTYFIAIYSNAAFMLGREPFIPPADDIKMVQNWLGLEDREPGWWFSRPFHYWSTWKEYLYYCDDIW